MSMRIRIETIKSEPNNHTARNVHNPHILNTIHKTKATENNESNKNLDLKLP